MAIVKPTYSDRLSVIPVCKSAGNVKIKPLPFDPLCLFVALANDP